MDINRRFTSLIQAAANASWEHDPFDLEAALQSTTRHVRHKRKHTDYTTDEDIDLAHDHDILTSACQPAAPSCRGTPAYKTTAGMAQATQQLRPVPGHASPPSAGVLRDSANSPRTTPSAMQGSLLLSPEYLDVKVEEEPVVRRVTRSQKLPDAELFLPAEMRPSSAAPRPKQLVTEPSPGQQREEAGGDDEMSKGAPTASGMESQEQAGPTTLPNEQVLCPGIAQMSFGGVMRENRIHRMARNILQYLLDHQRAGQPQTRELLIRRDFGNSPDTSKALRLLVGCRKASRKGRGGRYEPFHYEIPGAVLRDIASVGSSAPTPAKPHDGPSSNGPGSQQREDSPAMPPCTKGNSTAAAKAQLAESGRAEQQTENTNASKRQAAGQGRPANFQRMILGSSSAAQEKNSGGNGNTSTAPVPAVAACMAAAPKAAGTEAGAVLRLTPELQPGTQIAPSKFGFAQGLQVLQGAPVRTMPVAAATQSAPAAVSARVRPAAHAQRAAPKQTPSDSRDRMPASRSTLRIGSGLASQQGGSKSPLGSNVASMYSTQQLFQGSQRNTSSMTAFWQQQHTLQPQQQRSPRRSPGKENSPPGAHASVGSNPLSAHSGHTGSTTGQAGQAAGDPAMRQHPPQQQERGADVLGGLLQTLGQLAHLSQLQWLAEAQRMAKAPSQQLPPLAQQPVEWPMPLPLHGSLLAGSQGSQQPGATGASPLTGPPLFAPRASKPHP